MPGTTVQPSKKAEKVVESEFAFHFLGESYLKDQKSNNEEVQEFVKRYEFVSRAKNEAAGAMPIDQEAESMTNIMKDTRSTVSSDVGEDFESLEVECSVKDEEIANLLKRAANHHYYACFEHTVDQNIYLKCAALLKKDYVCKDFYNLSGTICWNYPMNILIPVAFKSNSPNTSNEDAIVEGSEMTNFVESFKDYLDFSEKAAVARCRCRFPVPVILYKNKFVCRSGTLAVRKGAVFEAMMKFFQSGSNVIGQLVSEPILPYMYSCATDIVKKVQDVLSLMVYGVEEMKEIDAKILRVLEVKYICDLMVENRKLHTGMWVSSSEKINMAKYGEFRCLQIPYPGCEFFKEYSKIKSSASYEKEKKSLVFDWESPEIDSNLGFAEEEALPFSELNWESYTNWDLVTLTKNYLKLLLHYLENAEGGLLVHCISGWDRTPLFISLLRLSLWADNLIHKELDVHQMTYFTLGYDWYLFGHNLPARLRKEEEIMHFFFKFLPEIASSEYSLIQDSEEKPKLLQNRIAKIESLSKLVLDNYDESTLIADPVEDFVFVDIADVQ